MALTTFGSFNLPPIQDQIKITGTYRQAFTPIENADGQVVQSGSGPIPLDMATINVTFSIRPSWLIAQGYNGGFSGMETAIVDFSTNVLHAGQQTLTDTLHTGAKSGAAGSVVASRSCTAQAGNQYDIEYETGAPIASVTMQLLCTQPYWTYADSTRVPMV